MKSEPLADFKVIHLAAHGVSDEVEPDRAALVLASGSDSEDGLWQAREIRRARMNADVVVLSACETGSGRLQGQEGVMNLASAFLTAGARSVVASLVGCRRPLDRDADGVVLRAPEGRIDGQ